MAAKENNLLIEHFRVNVFCPAESKERLNSILQNAWSSPGDNLLVRLSKSGYWPVEFYACSAVLTRDMMQVLRRELPQIQGSCAFIAKISTQEDHFFEAIGYQSDSRLFVTKTFDDCAALLGQQRTFEILGIEPNSFSRDLLLQTLITPLGKVSDGQIVQSVAVPWLAIAREIERDPNFLDQFSKYHRSFEEFLAACYDRAGFEVTLTPQRGDRGRDVIAIKRGLFTVRILDQAKAYQKNHLVTHDDVRAMLGVLTTDQNSSKGIITTTSDFQPGIRKGGEFSRFMPYRLELKNGAELRSWVSEIKSSS